MTRFSTSACNAIFTPWREDCMSSGAVVISLVTCRLARNRGRKCDNVGGGRVYFKLFLNLISGVEVRHLCIKCGIVAGGGNQVLARRR